MTEISHHIPDAMIAAYAAGALPQPFALVVATHVSLCLECRAAYHGHLAVGGAILEEEDGIGLSDGVKDNVLARLDTADDPTPAYRRSGAYPAPVVEALKGAQGNATVTMCHSGTRDLSAVTRAADIVVAAVGVPRMLGPEAIARGAVVVDVGINRIDAPERKTGTRLVGDVDYDALLGHAGAMTPVPGGVGPMTIAMLLENTWEAMCRAEGWHDAD